MAADIRPFSRNNKLFRNSSGESSISQLELGLINASPLLISLLHEFARSPGNLQLTRKQSGKASGGYFPGQSINIKKTGKDFVRLLGHELTHFYDDIVAMTFTRERSRFADIIAREMDESEATAASLIIRRQILIQTGDDIGISNRIHLFGGHSTVLDDLDREFRPRITRNITSDDFWGLTCEIAEKIWGKNFHTRPRKETNRWQDALTDTYTSNGQEIPDFLQVKGRVFSSAEIIRVGQEKKYKFVFAEASGALASYIYDGSAAHKMMGRFEDEQGELA